MVELERARSLADVTWDAVTLQSRCSQVEVEMGWWQTLFGRRERPEETLRLTRRVIDLLGEGKSDVEVERVLFREGVSVPRARSIVAEVRRVQQRVRGRPS
jgi:hypothetical protein